MTESVSYREFNQIYQEVVRYVLKHWNREMQVRLALHCHAWRPEAFDFGNYLELSSVRFFRAYTALTADRSAEKFCDIGGFWGVFPITLKRLGFDVAMTESLQYYGESFQPLFAAVREQGVRIFNYDPFVPDSTLNETFDALTVMALLEHYPHSLQTFMTNVIAMMRPDGRIYLEVPNLAYWPKRMALLRGQTPQAELADIFHSAVPFIGHHHEFTIGELRDLARLSGLEILNEDFYNYSNNAPVWKQLVRSPLSSAAFALMPASRECLAVLCRRNNRD